MRTFRLPPRFSFLASAAVFVHGLSALSVARAQDVDPPLEPAPVELEQPAAAAPSPSPPSPPVDAPAPAEVPHDDADEIRAPAWINDESETPGHLLPSKPVTALRARAYEHGKPWLGSLAFSLGAQGVLRALSADTGIAGQLRLQFGGEYSSAPDVVIRGDKNTRLGGAIAGSYSPGVGIEFFGALLGSSNQNRRVCRAGVCESEMGRVDPEVIRSFGDLVFGGKLAHQASQEWALAIYGQARLYSSTNGVFFDFGATSVAMGGLATWDLSTVRDIPLRLHANLGVYIDNSSNLQNFSGVGQPSELAASFAYGMGRSRMQNALALEIAPFRLGGGISILPFIEYQLDWVLGKANPRFADFTTPNCATSGRPCQENRDQQRFAFGLRGQVGSWNVTTALDFGLRSVGFPYGPPQANLTGVVLVSRPFDFGGQPPAAAPPPPPPPRLAAPAEEEPDDGLITGLVVSAQDRSPINNAIVTLLGRARSRVATDPDGTFTTHDVSPSVVNIEVSAAGFETQTVRAQVSAGLATEVEISLTPRPLAVVRGRIVDDRGKGLVGRILWGVGNGSSVSSDEQGRYEAALPPGIYFVRAEVAGHLWKEQRVSVEQNTAAELNFVLRPRKDVASAEYVGDKGLVVRLPITFMPPAKAGDVPTALTEASMQTLDEVVDVLVARPRITKLRIETHWDSVAIGRNNAQAITELQARAISDYLQAQGVAADRIATMPKGASQPVVPNVGRARQGNRRVVLTATEAN